MEDRPSISLLIYLMLFISDVTSKIHLSPAKNNEFSKLSNITKNILTSCNENYKTIVINGDGNKQVIQVIGELDNFSVMLHKKLSEIHRKLRYKYNKIDSCVLTVDNSVKNLQKTLRQFKQSPWWNIMTPYYLLSGSKNGCNRAKIFLKEVWKMDILNCYFICFDSKRRSLIYTFNPYSSRVPNQWQIVREVVTNESNYNYMAIFNRPYKEDICNGFNFDRTKYLDKTEVKIFTYGLESKMFYNDWLMTRAIKVVVNVSVLVGDYFDCYRKKTADLFDDKVSDFTLCLRTYDEIAQYDLSATFPTVLNGDYIFSNSQRYFSPMEKIYNSFDISLILGTIVVSIITYFVVLYSYSSKSHSFATFEILRLWTGNSLNTKIESQYLRIFFSSVFIYFFIMQATLQGDLVNFLSKTEQRKNGNFLLDLQSNYYKNIFIADNETSYFIKDNVVKSKIIEKSFIECTKAVIKDKSSACIIDYYKLKYSLQVMKLPDHTLQHFYLSKYPIQNHFQAYETRENWPLKNRFDYLLICFEASGLSSKIKDDTTSLIGSNLQTSQYITSFQSISLDALSLIFYLWIIGILCSIVSFFTERFIVAYKKKINRKIIHVYSEIRKNMQKIDCNFL